MKSKSLSLSRQQITVLSIRKMCTRLLAKLIDLLSIVALIIVVYFLMPTLVYAIGDNCKEVRIAVFNDHPVEVKITKIEYRDYDRDNKWRSEAMVNRKIATTKSYQFVKNLEHVKNDATKIKITYKEHLGGSRWSIEKTVEGAKHTCSKGEYNRIHLPGPSAYDYP